jgi:ribonuclease HII
MTRWSKIEQQLRAQGALLIAGVDEVGRGPLAGPVVACAVVMPAGARLIPGIADSKQLKPADRERLARLIRERALSVELGAASVRDIYQATALAMRRALNRLSVVPDAVLVDGKPIKTLGVEHQGVIGGDARCHSIACASIVAKVTRDRLMQALAARYPTYRWEKNSGYGTLEHISALRELGLSVHHRVAFCRTALS